MKCPTCSDHCLEQFEIAPGLSAKRCSKCGGSFVELEKFLDWPGRHQVSPKDAPAAASTFVAESSDARFCPACSRLMSRYKVSQQLPFHLDRCATCAGTWFDAGEWKAIETAGLLPRLHLVFSDSTQRSLRQQHQQQTHLERYKELLGDDFDRAHEIRAWLDKHPKRQIVIAFLTEPTRG